MRRLAITTILAIGGACMGLSGCLGLPQRPADRKVDSMVDGSEEEDSSPAEVTSARKSTFKPTRLPGGLSSEASEIERHLGVSGN